MPGLGLSPGDTEWVIPGPALKELTGQEGRQTRKAAQYDWHSDRRKHRVIQEARGVGGLPGGGGPSLKSG